MQMGWGGGHPDPEMRGGQSPKKAVWAKNKGGVGPPAPHPPWIRHCFHSSLGDWKYVWV